jgi:hypothetical protein
MLSPPVDTEIMLRLVRRIRHVFVIAPTQFIHQMLEMGRGRAGTQMLLQPLADGIADRSAGLAIDLFALVGDSAVHGEFRFVVISLSWCRNNSSGGKLFRLIGRLLAF